MHTPQIGTVAGRTRSVSRLLSEAGVPGTDHDGVDTDVVHRGPSSGPGCGAAGGPVGAVVPTGLPGATGRWVVAQPVTTSMTTEVGLVSTS